MLVRWLLLLSGVVATVGGLTGCDKLPFGSSASSEDVDEFAEFDESAADEAPGFDSADAPTTDDPQYTAEAGDFSLHLQVGARFPMIKTVEQRLTQQLGTGPVVGQTRLELRMSLLVEEQRQDARRLSVRYHRVRYAQDLGGEQVTYDSDAPPILVHPAALAYSGLKDNTFSFWLGADNRVTELVGFEEFLRRCTANVPLDQRNAVLQRLISLRSEDGIASFVDDSIGLLPNPHDPQVSGKSLQVGSSWELHSSQNASGSSGTRCMLKNLTPEIAEIAIVGTIDPSNYVDDVRQLKLTVRAGQCSGTCLVDRHTGMPRQSRIDRVVEMVAQLADGTEIPQRKEVVTTVVAYLEQAPAESATVSRAAFESGPGSSTGVLPVNGQR